VAVGAGEARLERMRRPADYPLTLLLINPLNRRLVRPLHRLGVPPTAVTWASLVLALPAAVALYYAAQRELWACLAAPLLVFASHVCDALDGDLARYSDRRSAFGAALDPIFDRVTEVLYLASLAAGLWRLEADVLVWVLAVAAIGGDLVYYYTTDAQVAGALRAGANDPRRYSVTLGAGGAGGDKTRVKLGLYEPFLYSVAVLAAVGWGVGALWIWAVAFWPAWVGQVVKLRRITRQPREPGPGT
jgi:phosphatidylglycerophosphate synthase